MRYLLFISLMLCANALQSQINMQHFKLPKKDLTAGKSTFESKSLPKSVMFFEAVSLDGKEYNPFFCKIEDAIARSSKVKFKFRLGSVQYVDALEGKSYWEAVSYSKATNQHLKRSPKKR